MRVIEVSRFNSSRIEGGDANAYDLWSSQDMMTRVVWKSWQLIMNLKFRQMSKKINK